MQYEIDSNWLIKIDGNQAPEVAIFRQDGKFFLVKIDRSLGYAQPIFVETENAEGICGTVVPVVRQIDGAWMVSVAENKRIGKDGPELLTEATRFSINNPAQTDLEFIQLGTGRSNSARIVGTIACGVLVADESWQQPPNARWITFAEFASCSDMMGQAALFRFLAKDCSFLTGS